MPRYCSDFITQHFLNFILHSSYAEHNIYCDKLFSDIFPWISENCLELNGEIWLPGISGIHEMVSTRLDLVFLLLPNYQAIKKYCFFIILFFYCKYVYIIVINDFFYNFMDVN